MIYELDQIYTFVTDLIENWKIEYIVELEDLTQKNRIE